MSDSPTLLPASLPGPTYRVISVFPAYSFVTWTLGRGSVIWRIWPAVLLHTVFAAVVAYLSLEKIFNLEIPSVMLTVLGVVIGFVISYRAISGYDRYWMGRTAWGDVIRNTRTLGRLVWFHVPLLLTVKTLEETQSGRRSRAVSELNKVMAEKHMAMDLIEAFASALKHHLRGEWGIYYEDLYHLVRPMHDHFHSADDHAHHPMSSALPKPRKAQRITPHVVEVIHPLSFTPPAAAIDSTLKIPPINAYGTFERSRQTSRPSGHRSPSQASSHSAQTQNRPLLPSRQTPTGQNRVSKDLIPFAFVYTSLRKKMQEFRQNDTLLEVAEPDLYSPEYIRRKWKLSVEFDLNIKHRPVVPAGGENLPLEILRCLSEWFSVLEDRGTVPGTSLGTMIGTIGALEDSLNALERILTTPLPFVYSVHIRHTVWMYLFFLPFQLVSQFGYSTIPGVAIAAFIYLGFLAAGEEMEQPFGYDENDLDLDLFCQLVVHEDVQALRTSPCLNAYFGPDPNEQRPLPHRSWTLSDATANEEIDSPVATH